MNLGWLLPALGLAALAFAAAFGGREERIFVLVQAASGAAEHGARFEHEVAGAILVKLAVLAILLWLALRTCKAWPLVVASLCVASLMTEAAQLLVHAAPTAYAITQDGWSLLADLVVAFGAWNVWQARRSGFPAAPGAKTPDPG